MVLESTVVCVDSSDYMRNGDFEPTRLDAQREAAKLFFHAKTRSKQQNNIALLTLARIEVLATLTTDARYFVSKLDEIVPNGCIDFVTALRTACLVLRNRPDKFYQMRIVVFIGSPVMSDEKELMSLAKRLKKEKVKVDIVNFGDDVLNNRMLTTFLSLLNGGGDGGSHMVSVAPGKILWHVLVNSPIVQAEDDAPFFYDTGCFDFDFENEDPTLALALHVSLEEHLQIEAMRTVENAAMDAAQAPPDDGARAMSFEEDLYEQLFRVSPKTGPVDVPTALWEQDYTVMTEEEKLAYAVQLTLHLFPPEISTEDLPYALAAEGEPMEIYESEKQLKEAEAAAPAAAADCDDILQDTAFTLSFIESLPDLGSVDEAVCATVVVQAEAAAAAAAAAAADCDDILQDTAFTLSVIESLPDLGSEDEALCNAVEDTIQEDESTPDKDNLAKGK